MIDLATRLQGVVSEGLRPADLAGPDVSPEAVPIVAGMGCMTEIQRTDSSSSARNQNRAAVLAVDPSPVSLLTLAGVLHGHGFSVVCARTADAALQAIDEARFEAIVWDVGQQGPTILDELEKLRGRSGAEGLPAVLIADATWAGLEKRTERLGVATRCLFKPIDPHSLLAVVDQLLWLPMLVEGHRLRGSRPSRPGWITL